MESKNVPPGLARVELHHKPKAELMLDSAQTEAWVHGVGGKVTP